MEDALSLRTIVGLLAGTDGCPVIAHPDQLASIAATPDSLSKLPLHRLFERVRDTVTEPIATLLLGAHSDAAAHADHKGRLPLHALCEEADYDYDCIGPDANKKPLFERLLDQLLNAHEAAAAAFDEKGSSALHKLCEFGSQRNLALGIPRLLLAAPTAARAEDAKGLKPLHLLCENTHKSLDGECGKTAELFSQLLKEHFPGAHAGRCTPLHLLCRYGPVGTASLKALLDADTHQAWAAAVDSIGQAPLHRLLARSVKKLKKLGPLLRALIEATPEPTRKLPDHRGCTPLYLWASSQHAGGVDVMKKLLSKEAAAHADAKLRRLPLHELCVTGARSREVLDRLLREYPEACEQKDADGYTPIAHACERKSKDRLSIASRLIEVSKASARLSLPDGKYPLHLLCSKAGTSLKAGTPKDFTDVMQALLVAAPVAAFSGPKTPYECLEGEDEATEAQAARAEALQAYREQVVALLPDFSLADPPAVKQSSCSGSARFWYRGPIPTARREVEQQAAGSHEWISSEEHGLVRARRALRRATRDSRHSFPPARLAATGGEPGPGSTLALLAHE
jgi:ankyrin repeat protein